MAGTVPPYQSQTDPYCMQRHLAHKEALLRQLPCSEMYETSFMHRDDVTHVAVTPNDFILTAGADGDLRFWKKQPVRGPSFQHLCCLRATPCEGLCEGLCYCITCVAHGHDPERLTGQCSELF